MTLDNTKRRLNIGIVCYSTYGGSGVIASEIGMAMSKRGHKVHFISADLPRRLDRFLENIYFHEVTFRDYPVFQSPPYDLGVASKIVEVASFQSLDIVHVHYAVPHATSAALAKQVLGDKAPKIVTTLHGTDITIVGYDRSYLPITRYSIMTSDLVTVPSVFLRNATYDKINVPSNKEITVIPNFVDREIYKPLTDDCSLEEGEKKFFSKIGCTKAKKIIVHTSNFRPVKRIPDVIKTFNLINKEIDSHLILIGDGPERYNAEMLVRELGLEEHVSFLGKQESFDCILKRADIFLLPSENESFGLAALEAMSCGVPVVASNAQGIPEVIVDGVTGYLHPVGAVEEFAKSCLKILRDDELNQKLRINSSNRAAELYEMNKVIDRYEQAYFDLIK